MNKNPVPSGNFLRYVAFAYLGADDENTKILNDAVTALRVKYPKYDIAEFEF